MVDEQFDTGTKVWAKVKGHPWWPGQVADPDDLSQLVKSQKPKRLPHSIPILFYGANNYGWLQTDAVRHFDDPSVEVPRKGGALQDAIQRARADDAPDGKLKVFEDDGDSESGENDEEDDQNEAVEDEEDDVDENPKSSARKSKSARKTPSKTPISERKSKNGKRKAENDETPSKRKRREKSEQDDDEDAEEPEMMKKAGKTKTPSKAKKVNKRVEERAEEPEKKKEKTRSAHDQLMYFRHKVQKMMKESPETLAASPKIDGIMTEVEAFPMTLNLLKDTKMGKLMKRMSQIKFTEDPYGIKDRTHRLMKRWKNDFAENLDKDAASEDTEVKKQPTEEISSISSSNKDEKENHRESPVKDSTTTAANTTTTVASPIKKKEVSSTLEENVKNSVDESSEIRSPVKESNAKQEPVVVSGEEKGLAENKGSDAEDLLSAEILNE